MCGKKPSAKFAIYNISAIYGGLGWAIYFWIFIAQAKVFTPNPHPNRGWLTYRILQGYPKATVERIVLWFFRQKLSTKSTKDTKRSQAY